MQAHGNAAGRCGWGGGVCGGVGGRKTLEEEMVLTGSRVKRKHKRHRRQVTAQQNGKGAVGGKYNAGTIRVNMP